MTSWLANEDDWTAKRAIIASNDKESKTRVSIAPQKILMFSKIWEQMYNIKDKQ